MTQTIPGVLSVTGADSQRLPLVFDSPHSGTDYPDDFGHIADPAILRNAEDTHVADLWAGAIDAGAVLLEAHFPRAYVDANRAPDDMDPAQIEGDYPGALNPTVKSRLGIGLCWTRVPPAGGPMYASRLTADQVAARVARYHRPYQSRLRALLDDAHTRWGAVWHVNCHSMQNVASAMSTQDRGTPRPDFVLGDLDGTACEAGLTETVRRFLTARGYSVAVNDPYKGMELIRASGDPANTRHSMQIEVNRKLYMDEATRQPNAGYAEIKACFTALAAHLASHVETQLEKDTRRMTEARKGSATGLPNPFPVELTPPDISAYAKGTGTIPYIWTFDSGQPGPHVAITAIVHGNEPCGALALDWLLRQGTRPVRGKLSFAFMNVAAHEAFDPQVPDASRWIDEDFNRLWSPAMLDDPDRPVTEEMRRAREVRPWLDTVDLLLDIHSMQSKAQALTMSGLQPKGRDLACSVGYPDLVINDHGHAEGMRMRDYGGFSDPASAKNAMLIECGQHWEKAAEGVALETAIRMLRATGATAPDFGADWMADRPARAPMQFLQVSRAVTIETDDFRFTRNWTGLERLPEGTLIGHDGPTEIRAPHPVTVLIMPSRRLWRGKTAVRLAEPVAG